MLRGRYFTWLSGWAGALLCVAWWLVYIMCRGGDDTYVLLYVFNYMCYRICAVDLGICRGITGWVTMNKSLVVALHLVLRVG